MQKEIIYQIMNGDLEVGQEYLSDNITVVDEFADGRECGRLYDKVYAAKLRLLEKLGTEENADVEEIIICMSGISRILAMKMYDYGVESR